MSPRDPHTGPSQPQTSTVLLRHTPEDGPPHYDWLIERDEVGDLLTFRVTDPIHESGQPFVAVRLADHRRIYLTFEGDIGGGRGRVARVASGLCRVEAESGDEIRVWLHLGVQCGLLLGSRQADDRWIFESSV